MKSIYTVRDAEGYIVAWARDLISAVGNMEYKEREGYINLVIKRTYEDDAEYRQIMRSIF